MNWQMAPRAELPWRVGCSMSERLHGAQAALGKALIEEYYSVENKVGGERGSDERDWVLAIETGLRLSKS